ncbi:hypothetical protein Tco_0883047 [Tanacetum coccineum]
MKMDAQYKEMQSVSNHSIPEYDEDEKPMSHEAEAKFMQTFRRTRFYNDYCDRDSNRDNWHSSRRNDYNRDNYRSNSDDKPYDLQRQLSDFMKAQQSTDAFVKETFMDLTTKLEKITKNHQALIQNLEAKFDRLADKQSGRPSGSLPSNTQPNPKGSSSKPYQPLQAQNEHVNAVFTRSGKSYDPPINPNDQQNNSETPINFDNFIILEMEEDSKVPLILGRPFLHTADAVIRVKLKQLNLGVEEDFDALLDEGSKILHSIEGTILEEKLFPKFDEFMAMTTDENYEPKSDTKEPPFEKITFNTDYKIKTSLKEPPLNFELKPLPDNLEYGFLEEPSFLPVIISS